MAMPLHCIASHCIALPRRRFRARVIWIRGLGFNHGLLACLLVGSVVVVEWNGMEASDVLMAVEYSSCMAGYECMFGLGCNSKVSFAAHLACIIS
jgi:hypothetical protein